MSHGAEARATTTRAGTDLVDLFMYGAPREQLDPIFDACVAVYQERLDEDGQLDFKGKAKVFTRTYDFLASGIPYTTP